MYEMLHEFISALDEDGVDVSYFPHDAQISVVKFAKYIAGKGTT